MKTDKQDGRALPEETENGGGAANVRAAVQRCWEWLKDPPRPLWMQYEHDNWIVQDAYATITWPALGEDTVEKLERLADRCWSNAGRALCLSFAASARRRAITRAERN